jgi:tetratricopeptide (TPR) repeat protein
LTADRYRGFVFIPADLAEDVDLDLERRKEVLFTEANLGGWDHWQVLGVRWNCSAADVKAAYLERVKVFHPDRYAGKRLGSFRGRLERCFRRMTEARDVLSDDGRRAAYAKTTAPPEEFARMEARKLEDERRAEERRARLARQNPVLARAGRVVELIQRGKAALADGRYAAAANDLLVAQTLDPQNREVAALAAEAKKRSAAGKAADLYHKALEKEAVGDSRAALEAFQQALEADPTHVRSATSGCRHALALGDLQVARQLADAAMKAAPRSGAAHEALGTVLEAEGNKKDARRTFERAVELDPQLSVARERLKKLRWGILG